MENGKVVVARLEMLLESKCEDLAFRLSKSCLMTYNSTHPLELDLNQNEYNYIMDMYLCCSFKIKNTSDLIAEVRLKPKVYGNFYVKLKVKIRRNLFNLERLLNPLNSLSSRLL